jgi:hypothetical protein
MEYLDPTESFSPRQNYLYELLNCEMTGGDRLALSWYMTKWEIERSRAEVVKTYPELSPRDQKLKWVEKTYGKELADGLRADLDRRAFVGEFPMG